MYTSTHFSWHIIFFNPRPLSHTKYSSFLVNKLLKPRDKFLIPLDERTWPVCVCVYAFSSRRQNRTALISDADTSDRRIRPARRGIVGSGVHMLSFDTARVPAAPLTVRSRVMIKYEKRVRHVSPTLLIAFCPPCSPTIVLYRNCRRPWSC